MLKEYGKGMGRVGIKFPYTHSSSSGTQLELEWDRLGRTIPSHVSPTHSETASHTQPPTLYKQTPRYPYHQLPPGRNGSAGGAPVPRSCSWRLKEVAGSSLSSAK